MYNSLLGERRCDIIYNILVKKKGLDRDGTGRTRNIIAKEMGLSPSAIDRCNFLFELGDRIMEIVDSKNIQETLAITIVRYMSVPTRDLLFYHVYKHNTVFTEKCLEEILACDKRGEMTQEMLSWIVEKCEREKEAEKERRKERRAKVTIPGDVIASFFPESYTEVQIEAEIINLLKMQKAQQ